MKKIFAILLASLLLLTLFSCGNKGDDTTDSEQTAAQKEVVDEYVFENFKYTVNIKGDYEITGFIYGGIELLDVVIPAEINTRPVTGIGKDAFKAMKNIKSVKIPDTVGYISDYAFYDCDYITQITLPASLTTIGMGAFQDCDALVEIAMNDKLTAIGDYAFKGCDSLTDVALPESLLTIGDGAFTECGELLEITVPTGVTEIGDLAFADCENLADITVLGEVENIGKFVFNDCAEDAVFNTTPGTAFDTYAVENGYKEATNETPNGPEATPEA